MITFKYSKQELQKAFQNSIDFHQEFLNRFFERLKVTSISEMSKLLTCASTEELRLCEQALTHHNAVRRFPELHNHCPEVAELTRDEVNIMIL